MNYLKILGHTEFESKELKEVVRKALGPKYMGFSRRPKLSNGSEEIHFPLGPLSVDDSFYLLSRVESAIKDTGSTLSKKKLEISIEAD